MAESNTITQFNTNSRALCVSTLICVLYSQVTLSYKTINVLLHFLRFAFHLSSCSCISRILAVHSGELSGHGSISLYVHITHLDLTRTDVVDQQIIAVKSNLWIKNTKLGTKVFQRPLTSSTCQV